MARKRKAAGGDGAGEHWSAIEEARRRVDAARAEVSRLKREAAAARRELDIARDELYRTIYAQTDSGGGPNGQAH